MKSILYLLFIAVTLITAPLPAQDLGQKLDELLKDKVLDDSDVSLAVFDLDDDTLLYSHRAHKLCRPASVAKVVTATVALTRLGCNYTIDTKLYTKNNPGGGCNLYIKGGLDPLFSEEDLMSMLSSLPAGMRIDTLVADCSFMDSIYWGPGWSWDDTPWEFQPYISPLMLNGGCVEITASPRAKGETPSVECIPSSSFYTIANEAVSHGGRGEKFTILRDWLNGSNVIRLRGDCNATKREKMNLYPSQQFFVSLMTERLAQRGINTESVQYSSTPDSCTLIAIVKRPIAEVANEALMESNNLCAEALSYHLGALYGKRPVRQEMGPKIMKGFLDYHIDTPEHYNIADGSGLSLYTYLSADILLQTLRLAHNNDTVRRIMMQGLPQSGISGTMKNRTKGGAAYKKIFAKTGTVKGVCTLAGYAHAANGHTLAFVIMNINSMQARAMRGWQDKVCDALCR